VSHPDSMHEAIDRNFNFSVARGLTWEGRIIRIHFER
jgi:hypothetical protein